MFSVCINVLITRANMFAACFLMVVLVGASVVSTVLDIVISFVLFLLVVLVLAVLILIR